VNLRTCQTNLITFLLIIVCVFSLISCTNSEIKIKEMSSNEVLSEEKVSNSDKSNSPFITLEISSGTRARYKIKENLTRFIDPITAVGETTVVDGTIHLDSEGKIIQPSSIFVNAKTFKSDESKRDNWIMGKGFLGDVIELNITDVESLPWPIPETGKATFNIIGELNISNVVKPTVWVADVGFSENSASGIAKTIITWEDFQIAKPRFPFIISVDDNIALEIDVNVTR
jgi:hypothetical protein